MEKRKNFYSNELNMERMEEVLQYVISSLTLKEVLKMIREISYDMVCYYNDEHKGIIYQDPSYDKEQQWQACQLQRLLSGACDLFGQSIINKNKFNESYLNRWINGGAMELQIASLKQQIADLTERNQLLENMERNGEF